MITQLRNPNVSYVDEVLLWENAWYASIYIIYYNYSISISKTVELKWNVQ